MQESPHCASCAHCFDHETGERRELDVCRTSLLVRAIESGNFDTFAEEYDAKPLHMRQDLAQTDAGVSAAYAAAVHRNVRALRWLAAHGVDIDAPAGDVGRTPLRRAVIGGYTEVVRVLLELGARPVLTNSLGETWQLTPEEMGIGADQAQNEFHGERIRQRRRSAAEEQKRAQETDRDALGGGGAPGGADGFFAELEGRAPSGASGVERPVCASPPFRASVDDDRDAGTPHCPAAC